MVHTSIDELSALYALDPTNADLASELVGCWQTLGNLLADRGDLAGARSTLATATTILDQLMARPIPKRGWRLTQTGHVVALRARLATSPKEIVDADRTLAAYLADIQKYENEGSQVPSQDMLAVASVGLAYGDLQSKLAHPEAAQVAWRSAAARLRPLAEHESPAAMTLLGQADLRLNGAQDARAWADRVMATSYRHPDFADLQKQLGPAQTTGVTPRP
jgi:hypothetical protein